MKRMVIFLGLLTALTACHGAGSSTSPSPIATTFVLTGTLREADETPIAGATVQVSGVAISPQTTTSGSDGTYRFERLAGELTLRVSKNGYREISTPITLSSNSVLDLKLDRLGRLISGEVYRGIVDGPPCDPTGWDANAPCHRILYTPSESGTVQLHLEWNGPSGLDLQFAGGYWPGINQTIDAFALVERGRQYEVRLNSYYKPVPFELKVELRSQ
jgi:hypothetical protein